MKNAKEMFEELGLYLDIETNEQQVVYSNGFVGANTITFDMEMESIYLDGVDDVSMLLLKAINKQVEELGWNK